MNLVFNKEDGHLRFFSINLLYELLMILLTLSSNNGFVFSMPMGAIEEATETVPESEAATNFWVPRSAEPNYYKYLDTYGYIEGGIQPGELLSEDVSENAVRKLQRLAGLNETGYFDEATKNYIKLTRCGNKDFEEDEYMDGRIVGKQQQQQHRSKRYTLNGYSWTKKALTYSILNYPRNLKYTRRREIDNIFERAFASWSAVTQLNFSIAKNGDADIRIKFVPGNHPCAKGNMNDDVLGHAFYPTPKSKFIEIHFNIKFEWTIGSSTSNSLFSTATHEIGHSLGLGHSGSLTAIMKPAGNKLDKLNNDDISAIQNLYLSRDDQQRDRFFTFNRRNFHEGGGKETRERDFLYGKKSLSLENCSGYMSKNDLYASIWNKDEKMCYIKRTFNNDNSEVTSYTAKGKALGHYVIHRDVDDLANTTSKVDLEGWINGGKCDRIVRFNNSPDEDVTTYKCKRYYADDCCTMIFRLGKRSEVLPDVMS